VSAEPEGGVVPIQSVQRAARFLELLAVPPYELSLADLVVRLELSRPTVQRYGMSLRSTGLVRYDAPRGMYSLAPRMIELGRAAQANLSILRIAQPHLERLSAETNQTAVLSLWDGEAPILVDTQDRTDRLVGLSIRVGSRLPPFSSAQGLTFLAFSAAARAAHAGTAALAGVQDELEAVRAAGVAITDGVIPGISAFAAPVLSAGEAAGAVALVCHQSAVPAGHDAPEVAALRDCAAQISARL
jgi:IclR family acetate operon transcriptional repressor